MAGAILLISIAQAFADPEILKGIPRLTFYKAGAATGLLLAVVVLLVWQLQGRALSELGLATWAGHDAGTTFLVALVWPMVLLLPVGLGIGPARAPLTRYYARFRHLMPARRSELAPAYAAGSLASAGEEVAFRGFLLWYLQLFTGLTAALFVSSVIFGIAHGYQGRAGMIFATVAGLVLGAAYLWSGSLLLALWMHASYNLASFTLGYLLLRDEPRHLEGD